MRRKVLGFLTDDLLGWWLSGTHDAEMREWWATDDAVDTAKATIRVVFESLKEHGYEITKRTA